MKKSGRLSRIRRDSLPHTVEQKNIPNRSGRHRHGEACSVLADSRVINQQSVCTGYPVMQSWHRRHVTATSSHRNNVRRYGLLEELAELPTFFASYA